MPKPKIPDEIRESHCRKEQPMKKQIEEMAKLQARLIKRSCTEYNSTTSMLLTEASRAIGELIACGSQQSDKLVEVVRCKDCKHYDESCNCCKHEDALNRIDKNHYCSYGERREK